MKQITCFLFITWSVSLYAQRNDKTGNNQYAKLPVQEIDCRIYDPLVSDSTYQQVALQHSTAINKINDSLFHITVEIKPGHPYALNNIHVPVGIELSDRDELEAAKHAFHWVPNIKRSPEDIIAQHVFRSPVMIMTLKKRAVIFIPDIHQMEKNRIAPWYMDLNYGTDNICLDYGMTNYKVNSHQYYSPKNRSFPVTRKLYIGFYILITKPDPLTALKTTTAFLWQRFAKEYTRTTLPQVVPFETYADTGYAMALKNYWVQAADPDKGGITLSTFYDNTTGKYGGRLFKNDVWNHTWFNNTRTAYGLYYWGKTLQREEWKKKAGDCVRLILTAPDDAGWFPAIYIPGENRWVPSGEGGGEDLYHMPDNAWTAYWVMRFNDEMTSIAGADQFVQRFSKALLKVQNEDGSFPARVQVKTHAADPVLRYSASGAMATWFLEEMLLRKKVPQASVEEYKKAVTRSLDFLESAVLPDQRFEDFELYFSCSPKPMHYFDSTTNLYGQNTLSMQWCAEAYLQAYKLFGDRKYLQLGEYCLNILSLYQQVWNPPFLSVYAFGGFGVQNTDAEWNDARQAQFAETYLDYYFATRSKEYLERSVYACRASFALMVLPQNKLVCPKNYQGITVNGETENGNMAENYGHDGHDERSFQSGFHWGTGSALTTAAILQAKLTGLNIIKFK